MIDGLSLNKTFGDLEKKWLNNTKPRNHKLKLKQNQNVSK